MFNFIKFATSIKKSVMKVIKFFKKTPRVLGYLRSIIEWYRLFPAVLQCIEDFRKDMDLVLAAVAEIKKQQELQEGNILRLSNPKKD